MGFSRSVRSLLVCSSVVWISVVVAAQHDANSPTAPLKGVAIPQRPDLPRYVANPQALVVLGKALFWDVQVGSDGRMACATCHFHAGADHRVTNAIAGPATSMDVVRPNTTLTSGDFPFHTFENPNDNRSTSTRDRRDVVGSAGVVARIFVDTTDSSAADVGADSGTSDRFTLGGLKVRQVTSRNVPSVINAVFNVRNFWDGRASDIFNGVTPFGAADTLAGTYVQDGRSRSHGR